MLTRMSPISFISTSSFYRSPLSLRSAYSRICLSAVTSKEDLIPILPGRFLGYAHPNGEQHILDSGAWVACAGHDNEDSQCTTGDVGNIFEGSIGDHSGPYDGVTMGC